MKDTVIASRAGELTATTLGLAMTKWALRARRAGTLGCPNGRGGGWRRREVGRRGWLYLCALTLGIGGLAVPLLATAGEIALDRAEEIVAARIVRVMPGVVGIITEVSAEVTVRCGKDDTYVVKPDSERENGTGFIIHPDGWIATNGHVIKPVYKDDEEHITNFLQQAAKAACGPGLAKLPEKRRAARMEAILKDPENRKGVKLIKRLEVFLPTGEAQKGYPAVVKAYSPPIDPDLLPKGGGKPEPPMWDAALIKIEAPNLPTVRLAPSVGQAVALGAAGRHRRLSGRSGLA